MYTYVLTYEDMLLKIEINNSVLLIVFQPFKYGISI